MNRSWEIHPLGAFMVNRYRGWRRGGSHARPLRMVSRMLIPSMPQEFAVAVVPGVRANDGPTHLPRVMVGIPPAWKSASCDHPR
jgi:hypothetical protein